MFPGSRNVPNVPDVPNVPHDVPNIPGHVDQDGLLAEGYVAKISVLRLNIGSGMLRLSSCMLRLSLTSSVEGGGRGAKHCGRGPPWTNEVRLSLSMYELSLSIFFLQETHVVCLALESYFLLYG